MNDGRDIIKVFFEEPFYLEPLPPDYAADPRRRATEMGSIDALLPGDFSERPEPHAEDDLSEDGLDRPRPHYRIYLAGTDLEAERIGATAIGRPETWAEALVEAFGDSRWWVLREGRVEELALRAVPALLTAPADAPAVVVSHAEPFTSPFEAIATRDRRAVTSELKRLLEDADAVLVREPAHHGFDWSIFSVQPLLERLEPTLAARLSAGTRAFTAPYQKARSEERFYFEQWALDEPPEWVTELHRGNDGSI